MSVMRWVILEGIVQKKRRRDQVHGEVDQKIDLFLLKVDLNQDNVGDTVLIEGVEKREEAMIEEVIREDGAGNQIDIEDKDRIVEGADLVVEEEDLIVEEKDLIVEEKDLTVEEKDLTVEMKDLTVEKKDLKVEEVNLIVKDVIGKKKELEVLVEVNKKCLEATVVLKTNQKKNNQVLQKH